jgi:hypothetical protein
VAFFPELDAVDVRLRLHLRTCSASGSPQTPHVTVKCFARLHDSQAAVLVSYLAYVDGMEPGDAGVTVPVDSPVLIDDGDMARLAADRLGALADAGLRRKLYSRAEVVLRFHKRTHPWYSMDGVARSWVRFKDGVPQFVQSPLEWFRYSVGARARGLDLALPFPHAHTHTLTHSLSLSPSH